MAARKMVSDRRMARRGAWGEEGFFLPSVSFFLVFACCSFCFVFYFFPSFRTTTQKTERLEQAIPNILKSNVSLLGIHFTGGF